MNRVVSLYSEQRKLSMTAVTALWVDWENIRHFATPPLVFPRSDVGERSAAIPYWWRDGTQMWMMLLIGGKFASTNQTHYPDLGSERHQYGISALVVSRGNQCRRREMLAVFSSYVGGLFVFLITTPTDLVSLTIVFCHCKGFEFCELLKHNLQDELNEYLSCLL